MSTMSTLSSEEYEIINSPETEEDFRITEHHGVGLRTTKAYEYFA